MKLGKHYLLIILSSFQHLIKWCINYRLTNEYGKISDNIKMEYVKLDLKKKTIFCYFVNIFKIPLKTLRKICYFDDFAIKSVVIVGRKVL